jgi:hypothetical protein
MPRKPRIEYPRAIDHVMNRGDRREDIFKDDEDRERFLATLGEACAKRNGRFNLGSEIVEEKTNEIPVAPRLLQRLDVQGRFVSLDALNTQRETARAIVMEGHLRQ